MKKGPLSNKEKEYIESFYKIASIKELSHRMDRSISILEKFVDTIKIEPSKKNKGAASKLLARNKDRGVVVMTESSSMESDKTKKTNKQPGRYNKMIHRIK